MKNKPNCDASGHFPSSVVRMGKMTKISSQMTRRVSCFGHWRHYIASNFVIYCHQGQRMAEWQQNANTPPQGQGVERFEPCTLLYLISPLVVLQPYCVTMAGKVYVCNSFLPKGHVNPSTKLNQEIRYKGLPLDVRF